MNYKDAIKDLIYRYLEFIDYDIQEKERFVKEINDIIKE